MTPTLESEVPTAPAAIVRGRHLPALDGLRALAILGVLFFHLGHPLFAGGYLGVDLFFVLSGFLITSLLLEERMVTGSVGLGAFYVRRARRLLPGLYVLLVATVGATIVMGRWLPAKGPVTPLHQLRWDSITSVFYVSNWYMQIQGTGRLVATRALGQVWSLSIEEQFYLVWPAIALGLIALGAVRWRRLGVVMTAIGALASTVYMAILSSGPNGAMHAYLSTFSRSFDLFVGAGLAFCLAAGSSLTPNIHRVARWLAPFCALGLVVFWSIGEHGGIIKWPSTFMYRGGFLLAAVLAAVVIADATSDTPSVIGQGLRFRPLVLIGLISYGLYLYHWPVNFFLTPDVVGFGGFALDAFHLVLTFAIATMSYYLIEQPLRRASYEGWKRLAWPAATVAVLTMTVIGTMPATAQPFAGPVPTKPFVMSAGQIPRTSGILGAPLTSPDRLGSSQIRVGLIGDDSMQRLAGPLIGALASSGATASIITGPGWGLVDSAGGKLAPTGVATNIALTAFGVHHAHQSLVLLSWSLSDRQTLLSHPLQERDALDRLIGALVGAPAGTDVVLLSQPSPTSQDPASPQTALAVNRWNAMASREVSLHPGRVGFASVGSVLRSTTSTSPIWLPPANRSSAPLATWVRVRMTDGVGVCQPGVVREAGATVAALGALVGFRHASGSWWRGSWTEYLRYDEPGRCLNDHPPKS